MTFEEAFNPVRALQSAWELVKRAPAALLVGAIILLVTDNGGGINVDFRDMFEGDYERIRPVAEFWPLIAGAVAFGCCLGLVFFLISSWIYTGFGRAVESTMRTGDTEVGTVFDARGQFVSMLLTRLLVGLLELAVVLPLLAIAAAAAIAVRSEVLDQSLAAIGILCAVLVFLPVILYVVLGLSLAVQACAIEGLKPVDSIRRSWSIASGHRLWLLLFHVVMAVFTFIGVCACCVGVFFTGSLAKVGAFEAYVAYVRSAELPGWWSTTRAPRADAETWASAPPVPIPPPPQPSPERPLPPTTPPPLSETPPV